MNRRVTKRIYLLTVFGSAVVLAFNAIATPVGTAELKIVYPGTDWGQNVTISYKENLSDANYTTVNGWAGAFRVQNNGGDSLPAPVSSSVNPNDFYTFCTDVGAEVAWGASYTYSAESFATQDGVNPTWAENGVYWAAYLFNTYLPSAYTANQKAGLQIAIWEVLYDTVRDLYDGRFKLDSGPGSQATSYLSSLSGVTLAQAQAYDSTWLHPNPESQDGYLVQGLLYPDTTAALPPPTDAVPDGGATLVLFGLAMSGLAGLGLSRDRKRVCGFMFEPLSAVLPRRILSCS